MKRFKIILRMALRLVLVAFLIGVGYYLVHTYQILKQVHKLEPQVVQVLEENEMTEYRDLVLAIIVTESKGLGLDPMQSSESVYGESGSIVDKKESIEQGIAFLNEAMKQSKASDCDIWTAVQAYNFGLDYIDYVAENGGVTTVELAEQYSRDTLAPLLGNSEQGQYRYLKLHSLIYNGGYLYHNGGNFFYAEIVKMNQKKIQLTNFLF